MAEKTNTLKISDLDTETIKRIAAKAKELRKNKGYSYEGFASHAGINRNTYFKFEKSAESGDNFTIITLLKVIRGLDLTLPSFFEDI